jgi:hypothetical protein
LAAKGHPKKNLRSKNEDDNKKPKDREASPTCGDLSFGFDFKKVEDENDDEDENDWGSGARELRPTIAGIVCIKAIDQSGKRQVFRNQKGAPLNGYNILVNCM